MEKIIWHTEKRKLSQLKPYEQNPREASEKQYRDIKQSLEKFDLVEIPAINTDNTIIAGHLRTRVLTEKHGAEHEIEVRVPNRELTPEEFREYLIRSNKNTGAWDFDALANWFDEEELEQWGFEPWELSPVDVSEQEEEKEPTINKTHECPECGCIF